MKKHFVKHLHLILLAIVLFFAVVALRAQASEHKLNVVEQVDISHYTTVYKVYDANSETACYVAVSSPSAFSSQSLSEYPAISCLH